MERFLQYVWKHRLFSSNHLLTANGNKIEVIYTGVPNHKYGPNFLNARILIDGILWVGDVHLDECSSFWYKHGHSENKYFETTILHVVRKIDIDKISTSSGKEIQQLLLCIPQVVEDRYVSLFDVSRPYPPCYDVIKTLEKVTVHNWLSTLQTERLEGKAIHINTIATRWKNDWEKTFFIMLARNFGFSKNGDAFEKWAESISLSNIAHHSDNVFQIEAYFLGQSGLLFDSKLGKFATNSVHPYTLKDLQKEYKFLQHKFLLSPIESSVWQYSHMRPYNLPHLRILQLAHLFYEDRIRLSKLIECDTIDDVERLFDISFSTLWGNNSKISKFSIRLLLINTVIPMMFTYGKYLSNEKICLKSLSFLDRVKKESNHIINMWRERGVSVESAADTQALIQLKKEYCDKRRCLECRFGYEYIINK